MKRKEIIGNIAAKLGISDLNQMQRQMAETDLRDIILLAPTGSGKTLAFAIRMLRNIDLPTSGRKEGVSAVVIAPTRELVIQLGEVIRPIATGLKTVTFFGGHSMNDEINSINAAIPDIIISTPGRLVDHLKRQTIDITDAKSVILDEYDKSLQLGFYDEMRRIVRQLRRPTLRMLTSATPFVGNTESISPRANQIVEKPIFNLADFTTFDFSGQVVEPGNNTSIIQVISPTNDKLDTLVDLIRSLPNGRVIIFVNHRESAERIHRRLIKENLPAGLYHGGLEQTDRRMAIDLLANGTTPILVSTDLAARGLDIPQVAAVIHYHLPLQTETWTHRNGRTARQGAQGQIFAITSPDESLPQGIHPDRTIGHLTPSTDPIHSDTATIYFNAGKKEKISKGDIAGFLIQKGQLTKDEVGIIIVDDHHAIAAIPRTKAPATLALLAPERLKGKRVKTSLLTP